jgi:DNA mismatch repair protein MutS2
VAFRPGDLVHFAGLGTGRVIEARGQDRYAIEVKGRVVIAPARDLEPADPRPRRRAATTPAADARDTPSRAAASLDLHGRTVEEAVELVEAFINDALLAGHGEVVIIHGRGTGKVRDAVHLLLRRIATVVTFRLDPRNPGATIVTFA